MAQVNLAGELKYWIGFTMVPGVGPARLGLLLQAFGSLEAAWNAPAVGLKAAGLDSRTLASLEKRRASLNLDAELDKLDRAGVRALCWDDESYPALLREIDDPPPVIYVRGDLLPQDRTAVAVVGTRKASVYGREATNRLVTDLAHNGVTVVSGLARGIDTAAHKAALEAGGRTIAILACGLDMVYPAENATLAREVARHGALISEHPLGVKPEASHFPRRNRIMSGLSLGVLVVEASLDSGSHITVRCALEQNREVFAVPGSIFAPGSQGTHRWIREGAKLVTRAEDILEELNVAAMGQQLQLQDSLPVTPSEAAILRCLSAEPEHVDVLRRRAELPIAEVSSALTMMELKGLVRHVGGMNYVATR